MFTVALCEGERFTALSWGGLSLAIAGLIYLVLPGVGAPDPLGAGLMALSGVAWGFYSLLGRHVTNPLNASARNFIYLIPAAAILGFLGWPYDGVTMSGLALAVASGAIASGAGYVIWYSALPGLGASRAATVQLAVPAIAAFGGVVFLAEPVTLRLLAASALTLGGVAIVLTQRAPHILRP
jgi:drug/metabolite transporter (DMT)-like permease